MAEYPFAGQKSDMSSYPRDERGRYIVPADWQAPASFSGTVLKNGMEISYPGARGGGLHGQDALNYSRLADMLMGSNRSRPWGR